MSDKDIKRKLFGIVKSNGKKFFLIIIFLIVSSGIALALPLISKEIMDNGFIKGNFNVVIYYSGITLFLVVLDKVIEYIKEKMRASLKAEITYSLFEKAFRHFEKIKLSELNKKSNTEILNNLHSDISNISMLADSVFFMAVTQIFDILGGIAGLFIISWELTFIVLCFIPLKIWAVMLLSKIRNKIIYEYMQENSEFARWFGDTLSGIKEIKIFGLFSHKMKEFEHSQKKIVGIEKRLTIQESVNNTFDKILLQILTTALYIIGAKMVFNLNISVGSVFTFIAYSTYVIMPVSALFNLSLILSEIRPAAKRYYNFLNMEMETEYKEEAENTKCITAEMKYTPEITFRDVTFSYDKTYEVLKGISFSIHAGEKVALVGLNGSGKTTIINLLMRFYKPISGSIQINGVDIRNICINEYRKNISIVTQNSYLFDDTIKNNICLYKEIEEQKFIQILKDCNLYDFYCSIPEGYKVGQDGCQLSGGQRQKVLIARALATGNNLIILDEATSNVDMETENQINELIKTKLREKTILVISHKPSILKYMDKCIVLKDGKIDAIGVHEQLIKENQVYRSFIHTGRNAYNVSKSLVY
ncbi:ABC transporter ATP-binding protein [Ruminiclostridium herbifermentans]|uniref:ABC transporter ATP-binding protein n=1 Tax=Ruminiclostridium herbifermentans TaxID=2488810 RepID=A0A4U7JBV8_9FIRM|nr:ABC transporter ATP-binding protein [Ruminiclostridium herbifermentans]QNU67998.1 ABC transporter ATP-binding protein [Ruminiclostridium herbifermentans]